MSFSEIGRNYSGASLLERARTLDLSWASSVTFHHTGFPYLSMRPHGFSEQLLQNVAHGYRHDRGWDRGPHLFVDEEKIWGLSPLTESSIHAVSFNSNSLSIEVLGDYNHRDDPNSGRGQACWLRAFEAAAALYLAMGYATKDVTERTLKFHRDDPRTRKTCPGTKVDKDWVIAGVKAAMVALSGASVAAAEVGVPMPEELPDEDVEAARWQLEQIREEFALKDRAARYELEKRLHSVWWRLGQIEGRLRK